MFGEPYLVSQIKTRHDLLQNTEEISYDKEPLRNPRLGASNSFVSANKKGHPEVAGYPSVYQACISVLTTPIYNNKHNNLHRRERI